MFLYTQDKTVALSTIANDRVEQIECYTHHESVAKVFYVTFLDSGAP